MSTITTSDEHVNLCVVVGKVSADPILRTLPSGSEVLTIDVLSTIDDEKISVPVEVFEPDTLARQMETGDTVVAVGSVKRWFFRSGGATASRVRLQAKSLRNANDRSITDAAYELMHRAFSMQLVD